MLAPDTLLGPYRIIALLGAGGMGEVYRAHDPRFRRDVAIKIILPEVAGDPERMLRFEQEALAAGALNHPNVCTVHDLGTHEGSPFVVMELLEGQNLRERLESGALPVRKAVEFAVQAAEGLAAAHAKGIVHRDLKPENLFVTRDGRVKVLDFGLAKLTGPTALLDPGATATTATKSGTIMGSVGYMAPEQVRGLPADQRSDLFALGAILYEMLAGERAFRGPSSIETLHAILEDDPPPLPAGGPGVPARLEHITRHCLEKNPEDRFQTARDLAFDLRAALSEAEGASSGVTVPKSAPRRRLPWLGVAAVLVVAAAAGLFNWWRGRAAAPPAASAARRVVVAVFENQTGDASLDPLGRMTSDWLTQGLSRVEGLEVVPSTSVLFAPPARGAAGADPIRALARETGAGTVVSGSYYVQGDTLRLQARITDAVHGRLLQALDPVSGERGAPLEAIDALRQRVMGAVAASLEAVHELGTQQQPPLYDAYREFIAGFEIFGGDPAGALRHFERAAELDSTFLTPLFYEAYLRDQAGDHVRVEAILRTLAERREQLPPFGRYWLDAITAYASHRYPDALQHLRVAQKVAPRDPMTVLWIGFMARLCNRPRETVDAYQGFGAPPFAGHALAMSWLNNLSTALHMLGRFQHELDEVHGARARGPGQLEAVGWEVRALAALGRVGPLNRLIDESLTESAGGENPGAIMLAGAAELRAHGHADAGRTLGARAAEWFRGRLQREPGTEAWLAGLMDAQCQCERWTEARATCEQLAAGAPQNVDYLGKLGCLAARAGRRDEALRVSEELGRMSGPYLFGGHTYRRACIAALLGEKQTAVELLRQSLAEGRGYGVALHREIDLEPLRDYPAFKQLIRPRN